MAKIKSAKKVFIVLSGDFEGAPDELIVMGVFSTEAAALEFRNADYKESNDIDDEDEDMGPDLNSYFVDNGQTYWEVRESYLR